ncbi:hypothetical protein [Cohnella zeiphila]|uniref:Glycosyltransferase RgtA/B/C/D-like domain-containing protein n=1 Tax=Cohnella zeiphila TaxID=2761120 RepID=A0A7X0VWZ0_9BACL|nr:hypothetical protein [Cohnella zeiphila]MBB6733734.1 hypothetical protein [Cohnella zeiphila]
MNESNPARSRPIPGWVGACVAALGTLLLFPANSYNDPDTFWHIENGRYMLEHGVVLHHAIHTFQPGLPYVPHEVGFQLIEAALYNGFGWPGIYVLTAACFLLLVAGLYRLMTVSRKEAGLAGFPLSCLVLLALVGAWVYYHYFTSRPQMISSVLIVWYVSWMRQYRMTGQLRLALAMVLSSWLLANVHAGVWLVIAVVSGMQIVETLIRRDGTVRDAAVYAAVALAGLLNPGGYRSLFYILVVTRHHYNRLIDEWNPIDFGNWENVPIALMLLFFALTFLYSNKKNGFRWMLMIGTGYLGVTNYKQNLFLWLFVPYFAAAAMDTAPLLRFTAKLRFPLRLKGIVCGLAAGLLANALFVFVFPPSVDAKKYPVDEMAYLLAHTPQGVRPKVLARYGSSGYVMFRGGDVLCDGRQDPFITDASKGAYGWNSFERSMYGFSDRLPAIVQSDRPDYVIAQNDVSEKLMNQWIGAFGPPVYEGRYGRVFVIRRA